MKTLPSALTAHLQSGATTLCWCFKLTRADGTVMGFTDHDQPLTMNGVTYDALSGLSASAVQSQTGLAIDNLTAAGALTSDSLNEDDLAAGLYDNAAIEIWRVNWADVGQCVLMKSGGLGEVTRGKTGFSAEIRGLAAVLNQPQGRVFGYSCDAMLGDARCTVDLAAASYGGAGSVAAVTDNRRFSVAGLSAYADGWFAGGRLVWSGGANEGRAMEIKRHAVQGSLVTLELWQAMSDAVVVGDGFTLSAGCDKQFSTCRAKFANGANFRGHPYMPGNDAAIAYPTAGQPMDGKSRYGN